MWIFQILPSTAGMEFQLLWVGYCAILTTLSLHRSKAFLVLPESEVKRCWTNFRPITTVTQNCADKFEFFCAKFEFFLSPKFYDLEQLGAKIEGKFRSLAKDKIDYSKILNWWLKAASVSKFWKLLKEARMIGLEYEAKKNFNFF